MSTALNLAAYERLIEEDIEWLMQNTKPSLERDHIIVVLEDIKRFYYKQNYCINYPDINVIPPEFDIITNDK